MRRQLAIAGIACYLMVAACADGEVPSSGSPEPPALTGDWEELGHQGFVELLLGMSEDDAMQTGRLTIGETVGRCTGFYLAMYGDALQGAHGYFTRDVGLSVIHGQGNMHTPEGIKSGSPAAALRKSYAHLVGNPRFMTAALSDHSSYFFVVEQGSVARFGLSIPGDPCLTQWLRFRSDRMVEP